MKSSLIIPAFATEEAEAEWVDQNRDLISDEISKALAKGSLKRGSFVPPSQRARENAVIQLSLGDANRARELAEKRGMQYEVFLAELLHLQLQKEQLPAA